MGLFDALAPVVTREEDPWAMLRFPPRTWDLESMYRDYRGGEPVSAKHVMMATPAYNPPCLEFLHARELASRALADAGVVTTVLTSPGDSLVMRGRHSLMHEFFCSTATHLLFWDADIEPTDPEIVGHMLATGHDIIGGACPFRNDAGRVVCNLRQTDIERRRIDTDDTGCVAVSEVGTGFLLMSRVALLDLCEAHHELLYFSDLPTASGVPMWALFDTAIVEQRFLSEDYFFCKLARDEGYAVNVYVPFVARHWGRKGFEASFATAWGMREA